MPVLKRIGFLFNPVCIMKTYRHNYINLLAMLSFAVWFLLLTVGITINSAAYLDAMDGDKDRLSAFFMVMISFTPTNVALMAVWAGLSGGLTSNLAAENYFRHIDREKLDPSSPDFQRLIYMTESPIVSALRGFMVYMIFIVGANLSLTSNNDSVTNIFNMSRKIQKTEQRMDQEKTAGQAATTPDAKETVSKAGTESEAPPLYYRFALTVSLLAFLVGFDPSRLGSWVNSVPIVGSQPGGSVAKR